MTCVIVYIAHRTVIHIQMYMDSFHVCNRVCLLLLHEILDSKEYTTTQCNSHKTVILKKNELVQAGIKSTEFYAPN